MKLWNQPVVSFLESESQCTHLPQQVDVMARLYPVYSISHF